MFKKLLVTAAILAVSSSAMAAINSAPAPYLGGAVGLVNNSSDYNTDYRGISGTVFGGYGGIVSPCTYLGGEVFVVPGTLTMSESSFLKTSWSVGASFIPGYMLNDKTMAYARFGVVDSHFTTSGQTKAGGQAGLGLQTTLCQNWEVRGEYTYSKYGSSSGITSPASDGFNLGLVYRFE